MRHVVCVRQGDKYGPEWVDMLWKMVHQNVDEPIQFTCLSDRKNNCLTRKLRWEWPGWWAKMELFSPWNADIRPCLFIDLDSFVMGNITRSLNIGTKFKMACFGNKRSQPQSSIMQIPVFAGDIWRPWRESPETHMQNFKGDQDFLAQYNQGFVNEDISIWSYKKDKLQEPPDRGIVQFHGKPKPNSPDAAQWVREMWAEYGRNSAA